MLTECYTYIRRTQNLYASLCGLWRRISKSGEMDVSEGLFNHVYSEQCVNAVVNSFLETEQIRNIINATCNEPIKEETKSLFYEGYDELNIELSTLILSLINIPIVITVVSFILLTYLCFIRTINWKMDLSDIGYDFLWENKRWPSQSYKKMMVQQIKQLRKIGDLPPVYPNGWFALLESSDLKPSQVKYVAALGENFAVFRTEDGEVKILDAYCPHLGANMAVGGKVHGNCLECPFHGWKFNGDSGQCVEIPYSSCKVPTSAKVKTWHSNEVKDFIFVWYHAEGDAPSWNIQETPEIKTGQWWYRGRNEFTISSHIQEIPENGSDVSHLNAIHAPSMLGGTDIRNYDKTWLQFCKHKWSAKWSPSHEAKLKHTATIKLLHEMRLFEKFSFITMDVTVKQIGPSYVELRMDTSIGPVLVTQAVTPVEPMLQRIIHRVYCPPLLSPYANLILLGETIMVGRDIMVWNHKKYVKNPLLVKEDQQIQLYRRWYSQFYSENSPKFSFQRDAMDW